MTKLDFSIMPEIPEPMQALVEALHFGDYPLPEAQAEQAMEYLDQLHERMQQEIEEHEQ